MEMSRYCDPIINTKTNKNNRGIGRLEDVKGMARLASQSAIAKMQKERRRRRTR